MGLSIMATDIIMQVLFISTMLFMFLWMLDIPQSLFNKFRYRQKPIYAAKRHFVLGADLLSQSRSTGDPKLAAAAADHADKSIAINPNDAASHVLKALALDIQGFSTSALEALEAALAPLTAKSLSDWERSDALVKRAEIRVRVGGDGGGGEGAVADLVEAVRLNGGNAAALGLLGECYEKMERSEEALKVYKELVRVEPRSGVGLAALKRLGSGSD